VKVQLLIPVFHAHLEGYFSQPVLYKLMALMSAKPTQFSFPFVAPFL